MSSKAVPRVHLIVGVRARRADESPPANRPAVPGAGAAASATCA